MNKTSVEPVTHRPQKSELERRGFVAGHFPANWLPEGCPFWDLQLSLSHKNCGSASTVLSLSGTKGSNRSFRLQAWANPTVSCRVHGRGRSEEYLATHHVQSRRCANYEAFTVPNFVPSGSLDSLISAESMRAKHLDGYWRIQF
jgi:hypothetical protein